MKTFVDRDWTFMNEKIKETLPEEISKLLHFIGLKDNDLLIKYQILLNVMQHKACASILKKMYLGQEISDEEGKNFN